MYTVLHYFIIGIPAIIAGWMTYSEQLFKTKLANTAVTAVVIAPIYTVALAFFNS